MNQQLLYDVTCKLLLLRKHRDERHDRTSESEMLITGNAWYWDTVTEEQSLLSQGKQLIETMSRDEANQIIDRAMENMGYYK